MSEIASTPAEPKKKRGGCFIALVTCGVLLAVAAIGTCASIVGGFIWITRPGEVDADRSIVSGDETVYVAMHLEADDQALLAFLDRSIRTFQRKMQEQSRQQNDVPTFMSAYMEFANDRQTQSIKESLPVWVELGMYESYTDGSIDRVAFVASATLSKNYRVYQLMFTAASWSIGRSGGEVTPVGEAKLLEFPAAVEGESFAVANLGNTFFFSNDPAQLAAALERFQSPDPSRIPPAASATLAEAGGSFDIWSFTTTPAEWMERLARWGDGDGGPFGSGAPAMLPEGSAPDSAREACDGLPDIDIGVATFEVVSSDAVRMLVTGDAGGSRADLEAAGLYAGCFEAIFGRFDVEAELSEARRSATGGFTFAVDAKGLDDALGGVLDRSEIGESPPPVLAPPTDRGPEARDDS